VYVCGLGAVYEKVRGDCGSSGSLTLTLPSTIAGCTWLKSTPAVPLPDPEGVKYFVLSHVAVAVFVPLLGLGADA
jgi:hypothetical protein